MEETKNTPEQKVEKTSEDVKTAWGKMGLAIRDTDVKLQVMAQAALKKIKIPKTVEEIIEAEKTVTELRNDYTQILTERKKVTSILDGAIARLMEPEKLIVPAITPLTDAILSLKKQAEAEANKVKWHSDEIKQIKEQIAIHITNHDATCKRKIIDLVDKAYSFALGNGDIKAEEIDNYLSRVMKTDKCAEAEFKIVFPDKMILKYATADELNELWENAVIEVRSPMDYRQDLFDAFKAKFEFYDIAVKNKVESLKHAAEEKEIAENLIKKQTSEANTANTLNSLANVHNPTPVATHKDLKKVYELEMPEASEETALLIITAFVANYSKCKVRVKNIYNLSISQMAESLCKLKNEDEKFEFGNLKFKQIDKL